MNALYQVNYWMSDPCEDNDDCISGVEFESLDAARASFNLAPSEVLTWITDVAFVELVQVGDVPGYRSAQLGLREIPGVAALNRARAERECALDMASERRERALEAGMLHGIDAYNDEMGW